MALLDQLGVRVDPLLNCNFFIGLLADDPGVTDVLFAVTDFVVGGFSECTGLEMSLELEEYREGGVNGYVHKLPKHVKWGNITLKRGLAFNSTLWDWHYKLVDGIVERRNGVIALMQPQSIPIDGADPVLPVPHYVWYFEKALPVQYNGPSMNASQSEIAIESLVLAHHGLHRIRALDISVGSAATAGRIAQQLF